MTKGSALAALPIGGGLAIDDADMSDPRRCLAQTRLCCRAWGDSVDDAGRDGHAAVFAWRAMETFARYAAPACRLSEANAPVDATLDKVATRLATAFGRGAAALPLAEGLNAVTGLYPMLLSARNRGALGAYYTPPALTNRLLDQATGQGVDWTTARVLDPASGGGAFLVPVALRMRAAMHDCEPAFVLRHIGSRLSGLEIDPHAAALAQGALEIALADLAARSGLPVAKMVRVCDALNERPTEAFDLVVGNPPYGRVALTPEQRLRYSRGLYGHANLYGVFTDLAVRWTKPGGMIAYLTPTSFLAGRYFSALRGVLAREAPPIAIDFVHARKGVFEDVLQETMLTLYRKGASQGRAQVHYLQLASERDASVTRNGTVGLPPDTTGPWLAPRNAEHGPLIAVAEGMSSRLADWGYSVSTGPLVWNRFKSRMRERPEGRTVRPLVWAEAVTPDGRFVFRADKKGHSPFFKLEDGDDWLMVTEPCVLVQRTTAKEQARRIIAAELPAKFIEKHGGVVVENHLNMVRSSGAPKVPAAVLAAILNSRVLDDLFRCMNGSVAVSAFELESLPVPAAGEMCRLADLVASGAARPEIEAECRRLYRLGG